MSCYNRYSCNSCSKDSDCVWIYNGGYASTGGYCTYYWVYANNGFSQSTAYCYTNGGIVVFWVSLGSYFVISGIIGVILWKKRRNQEGGNEPEVSEDPMDMKFDKRFKRSEEADCLRNLIGFIYFYSRKGIFNVLSVLLGIILALLWGYAMGLYEFFLVWFVLPYLDIIKRVYLPLAKVVGDVMDSIYGQCLRNIKAQPASFLFNGVYGNNNAIKYDNNDDNDYEQKFDNNSKENDQFGLKFITAFPKSDEIDGIRKIERICYDICRIGGYNFLTAIIGLPLSLLWGLIYGILQFLIIWWINPAIKVYRMYLIPAGQVVGSFMNAIYGKCLRNIRSEPYFFGFSGNNNNNDINQLQTTSGQTVEQTSGPGFVSKYDPVATRDNKAEIVADGDDINNNNNNTYPNVNIPPMQTNQEIYN